jgi:hypothetical protein
MNHQFLIVFSKLCQKMWKGIIFEYCIGKRVSQMANNQKKSLSPRGYCPSSDRYGYINALILPLVRCLMNNAHVTSQPLLIKWISWLHHSLVKSLANNCLWIEALHLLLSQIRRLSRKLRKVVAQHSVWKISPKVYYHPILQQSNAYLRQQ